MHPHHASAARRRKRKIVYTRRWYLLVAVLMLVIGITLFELLPSVSVNSSWLSALLGEVRCGGEVMGICGALLFVVAILGYMDPERRR